MPQSELTKLQVELGQAITRLNEVDKKLETLVTRVEFKHVQMIVYGMVAIALSSVFGALLAKVIIK
jgi:hypothetical protein